MFHCSRLHHNQWAKPRRNTPSTGRSSWGSINRDHGEETWYMDQNYWHRSYYNSKRYKFHKCSSQPLFERDSILDHPFLLINFRLSGNFDDFDLRNHSVRTVFELPSSGTIWDGVVDISQLPGCVCCPSLDDCFPEWKRQLCVIDIFY